MENLLTRLAELGEKSDYLNQKLKALVMENRALHRKIQELELRLAEQEKAHQDLVEQRDLAKLATLVKNRDEAATEELKKKINEYIREIDQCLKLIGD